MHKLKKFYYNSRILRSIRLRIFLLVLTAGIRPCLILSFSLPRGYESRIVNARASEVQTQLRVLSNQLISSDYFHNTDNEIINTELTQIASFYDGRVLVIDDTLRVIRDTFAVSEGKTIVSEDVVRCLSQPGTEAVSRYVPEDRYIEVILPVRQTPSLQETEYAASGAEAGTAQTQGVLLVSVSTESIEAAVSSLERFALLLGAVLSLIVFAAALIVPGILLIPFDKLTKVISDVSSGFSTEPVKVDDYIETQRISDAFGEVVTRMRTLDESRQEFVTNVSHELKTPMTSMKVLADSLLSDPDTPAETYREFLSDIDTEIDRENRIIEELLNVSRLENKKAAMNISQVNINEFLETILKNIRPLAAKRDIELTLVSEREVIAEVDEVKLGMVFRNLIDNAVKYNKEHGKVIVTVNSDHKNFYVSVRETGIGIPEESFPNIYERFYRVDKSRSRQIGGTGLGLSIAKASVLLHKGSISLESEPDVGTVFHVTIPLNYVA